MKRKILIASFLKPVNDIRAYEKMAVSIAKNNRYKVYCTGYPVNSEIIDKKVELIPLKSFAKNRLSRLSARWKVLKLYIKLKPELIIVNSPDLLIITTLYRILFGGQICYDIQENYFRNLWYQKNYPLLLRHILAITVRAREYITSPLFNYFFIAEKTYINQLKFIRNKYTLLENKCLQPATKNTNQVVENGPVFLISGTLAKEYGLFEGIHFFTLLSSIIPKAKLKIIGHCPNKKTYESLIQNVKGQTNIELSVSKNPVLHSNIIDTLLECNYGLLPYLPNRSTEGKWPTKLYEYMGYKLPFIIQTNSLWNKFIEQTNSGLAFDFTSLDKDSVEQMVQRLNASQFYSTTLPLEIFWNNEEDKLLNTISNLL